MPTHLLRELRKLKHGDHVCPIHENATEQVAVAVHFIMHGLEKGERCIYVADHLSVEKTFRAFATAGMDVARERERGALQILTEQDSYLRSGEFNAEAMIDFLAQTEVAALADGFSGLRALGEMSWVTGAHVNCDRLIEYETLLNKFLAGSHSIISCQYNHARFDPAVIHDILRAHPVAVLGELVCPNPYYEPPELTLCAEQRASAEFKRKRVSWWIARLKAARRAEQEREQARQLVQESRERLQSILDSMFAFVVLLTPEGILMEVNRAPLEAAALGSQEVIGQPFAETYWWSYSAEAQAQLRGALKRAAQGETVRDDFQVRIAGQQVITVDTIFSPLRDASGKIVQLVVSAVDITERKKATEALVKSEREQRELAAQLEIERARLVAAQAVAKIGSWETDLSPLAEIWSAETSRILSSDASLAPLSVFWSAETFRIFETDPAQFQPTHQGFLRFVHPDDRAMVHRAFAESFDQRSACAIEHRLLIADGRIKFVEERWQVFHDEQGQPLRALGTCRDITERKLAEAEVQRTTDLLQAVAEGTSDAVFVKDLQGRYLFSNEAAARFVGRSIEEVLGRDDTAFFGAEDARLIMESDRRGMESNQAETTEEILTAAGVTRTFLATKAPYRDGQGNVIGVIGISRDITERKQAEERVREQAAMLDQAHDAIIVRDLYTRRITYWNQGAERLYGWSVTEAEGRDIGELIFADPNVPDAVTEELLRAGEWRGESRQVTKAGRKLMVSGHATLVRDAQGAPKSALVINIDVTAQKELEARFLRAQRMESIGTLAGGIAHDLNNVLGPIITALELLAMKFTDPGSQELLAILSSSAQRGADMVRQVLSFARGVEGRRMEVQVRHLVQEIEKIANDTFLKHIQVRTIIPHDLWTVLGDPTQLHQVLLNLCVNARDAMPNGGTLTISAENLTLDAHYAGLDLEAKPGPYVFLQVKDSGTGMPPEVVERIFDPFFTTKEVGKGTGLGLSTSLGIVKSHGGFIRVYSELGNGTNFQVYLPAQTEASPAAEAELAAQIPRGRGELILVVDDEASVRQITKQTLEAFGYRVILASDGAEAVAVFARQGAEIAAVLTDMTMPVMDGPAAIQVLRKMNPKVPIIAASGLSANAQVAHAASLGVQHFLPKPYTAEILLKTLKQVLSAEA